MAYVKCLTPCSIELDMPFILARIGSFLHSLHRHAYKRCTLLYAGSIWQGIVPWSSRNENALAVDKLQMSP